MLKEVIQEINEGKAIRVIKYDPETEKATEEKIGNWKDYGKLIGCRTFTVDPSNTDFDIYCDDEGLLSPNLITKVKGSYAPLAGVLIFTGKPDAEGETLPLGNNFKTKDIEKLCVPQGDNY